MQFFSVKTRSKIDVDDGKLTKKKYVRTTKNGSTQVRYAVRAKYDGSNLTKFVSESAFKDLNAPEEA